MEAIAESQFDNLCCLVVDDDKFSRSFIKTALYQIGIKTIKEAASASEATEILRNFNVNLVLLDQIMEEKNGIEFALEIRGGKISDNKDIPIVMITVDNHEKTVLAARNLGIKEYLIKPISPQALKKRIINTLEQKTDGQ